MRGPRTPARRSACGCRRSPDSTTWPAASSTRVPSRRSPISETTPSVIATSAARRGAPVPSINVPPRITMSAVTGSPSVVGAIVPLSLARLTRVSGSGDPSGMGEIPESMPAAVFQGLRAVTVEERPTPAARAARRAHRGQPLRDLRLRPALPHGVGRPRGRDRRARVQRNRRGDRSRGRRLGRRRPGRRRSGCEVRPLRVLPRAPAVAVHRTRSSRNRRGRVAGRLRPLQGDPREPDAAHPRRPRVEARRARGADGGRAARNHPRWGRTPRHPLARHRWGTDRLLVGRRVEGPRRRRHRRERAARIAACALRTTRCAHACIPTSSPCR